MKKMIIKLLTVFFLSFSIMGCAKPENKTNEKIVLNDHLNREVVLDKPAETIVSTYYITTTTLIALDAQEQLVGVEMKADERDIYKLAAPEILSLPAMGNKKNFNIEECAKLNPDLVVLPMGLKEYVSQLEKLNIPVLVINPETMDNFLSGVELLAKASGHEERAQQLLADYQRISSIVDNKTSGVQDEKRVYFSSGNSILRAASSDMFQNELIQAARGSSVTSDIEGMNWSEISAEALLQMNPSYVFVENHADSLINEFSQDERFATIEAVKNQQVYSFPSSIDTWDTPSPTSILGIYWMSSILYPDLIDMEEVESEAVAFYKKYFNLEVSAEQLGI